MPRPKLTDLTLKQRSVEQRRADITSRYSIELTLTSRAALAKELCHCGPDVVACGRVQRGRLCERTAEEWLAPAIGPDSPDFIPLALARKAAGTLSPEIGRWLERHGHA